MNLQPVVYDKLPPLDGINSATDSRSWPRTSYQKSFTTNTWSP